MSTGERTRERQYVLLGQRGFTLIELMVVVAIIGVLASIAVPGFIKNARKAKSTEAIVQLNRIYSASRTYILELHNSAGSARVLAPQFPDAEGMTPASNCCLSVGQRCAPLPSAWASPTWLALQFAIDSPHYYRYAYDSTGSTHPGLGSTFTAQAFGDLNCDGTYSTFEMFGQWNSLDHDVHGSAAFYSDKDLD
jgi:prepilin-type N-terminal cleavage/methylation domain-containing protein